MKANELSKTEKILLILPMIGGTLFGLFPFLLGGAFGSLFGAPGNDSFVYRLAGAASFGYVVALALGLRQNAWTPVRLVVVAVLVFNLASLYACVTELASGDNAWVVYFILLVSILIVGLTIWMLTRHGAAPRPAPDLAQWQVYLLALGVVLSGTFGALALFVPVQAAQFFGLKGTDMFLYRQAGAATLGYAVMALLGLRSRAWEEVRLPTVMGLVFNGLSFIASVIALPAGEPTFFVVLIGAASLFVTVMSLFSLRGESPQPGLATR